MKVLEFVHFFEYMLFKIKTLLVESFGQCLLAIITALSILVQPNEKGSALYKYLINCCKHNLERSIDPKILTRDYC